MSGVSGGQRVGVKAVVDTSGVTRGVKAYTDALNRMVAATTAAASRLEIRPKVLGTASVITDLYAMNKAIATTVNELRTLNGVRTSFRGMSADLRSAAGAVASLTGQLQRVRLETANVNRSARDTGTAFRAGFGAAIGTALINSIGAITQGLGSMGRAVADNVSFWERLTTAIAFFETRSLNASDQALSYAERIALVGEKAQATTLWVQKLAIISPYTSKEVGDVFRVAQAYGLSADTAKELLPLLLNLGSAAGFDADVLSRVALALGQVQARGKLTGEEIRQLGNAGIPIRDILVKNLGIANSEFEDFVEEGMLTADVVIPLIIRSLKEFDGAAETISKTTLVGLGNAIQETFQIGTFDLFKGVGAALIEPLQELLDFLTQSNFRAALTVIGEELGKAFSLALSTIRTAVTNLITAIQSISPEMAKFLIFFAVGATAVVGLSVAFFALSSIIGLLVNPVTLLAAAFGTLFGLIASGNPTKLITDFFDAISEGAVDAAKTVIGFVGDIGQGFQDIADTFGDAAGQMADYANGLVTIFIDAFSGLVSVVGQAMSALAGAFSFWMEPHSPPRFLPDIDKWGAETAQIYLEGWQKADFSTLKDISGLMEDFLTSLVPSGDKGGKVGVLDTVIGSRDAIKAAIDQIRQFGKISEDVFARIRATAGAASGVVVEYLQRYEVLANATKAVEVAQATLNAITEKYTALLKPLNKRLNAIKDAQAASAEQKEIGRLQSVIASKYATDARKKQAALELEALLLQKQIRETENAQKADTEAAQDKLDNAEETQSAAEDELDLFEERIRLGIDERDMAIERDKAMQSIVGAARAATKAAKEGLSPLEKQLKLIQLQQEELRGRIEIEKAKLVLQDDNATAAEKEAARLTIAREEAESALRTIEAAELGGTLDDVRAIQIVMDDLVNGKSGGAKGLPGLDALKDGIDDASTSAEEFNKDLQDWKTSIENFRTKFDETMANIVTKFREVNDALPDFLKFFIEGKGSTKDNLIIDPEAGSPFLNVAKYALIAWAALKTFTTAWGALAIIFGPIGSTIVSVGGAILGVVGTIFGAVVGLISGIVGAIVGFFQTILFIVAAITGTSAAVAGAIIAGVAVLVGAIVAYVTNFYGFRDKVNAAAQQVYDFFADLFPKIGQTISDWAQKALETVSTFATDTYAAISEFVTNIINRFREWFDSVTADSDQWGKRFGTFLGTALANALQWGFDMGVALRDWIIGLPDQIASLLETVKTTLSDWYTTAVDTAIQFATDIKNAFTDWIDETLPKIISWAFDASVAISDFLTNLPGNIATWLTDAYNNVVAFTVDALKAITDFTADIADSLSTAVNTIVEEIGSLSTRAVDALTSFGADMLDGFREGLSTTEIGKKVLEIVDDFIAKFKEFLGIGSPSTLMQEDVGRPMLDGIVEAFVVYIDTAWNTIKDTILTLKDTLTDTDTISQFMSSATTLATRTIDAVVDYVTGAFQRLRDALTSMVETALSSDFLQSIADKALAIGDAIIDAIDDALRAGWEVIQGAIDWLLDLIPDWIKDLLQGKLPNIPFLGDNPPAEQSQRAGRSLADQIGKSVAGAIGSTLGTVIGATTPTRLTSSPTMQPAMSSTYNFNLTAQTAQSSGSIRRDFAIMRTLAGA